MNLSEKKNQSVSIANSSSNLKYNSAAIASSNTNGSYGLANATSNWTSTSLGTLTTSDLFIQTMMNSYDNDFLRLFVLSHNETEIMYSLSKVKELCISYQNDRTSWENIVLAVLRVKHFSEEFIVNYLDEVSNSEQLKHAILVHHAGEVYSKTYPTVALKILLEK